jgi:membrane-associated protein
MRLKIVLNLAASFNEQLSPVAPFLFYVVIAGIIFVETGLLIGFFLPGDSLLFSAGLVAAARDDINIVFLVIAIFLAAFIGVCCGSGAEQPIQNAAHWHKPKG